jgi:hypothetical protein
VRRFVIVLGALAALVGGRLAAQEASGCGMQSMGGSESGMRMDRAMIMRMDSMDLALDSLAKAMNAARGARKMSAMTALLNLLVAHHQEMRRSMREGPMGMQCGGEAGMAGMSGMSGMSGGHGGVPCDRPQAPGIDSSGGQADHRRD